MFFSRAFVPAVLLGEVEPKISEQPGKTQDQPAVRNHSSEYFLYPFQVSLWFPPFFQSLLCF